MKKKLIYTAVIISSFFLFACTPANQTGVEETPNDLYEVISITDGDTIKVDINGETETLRLIGMDTPETVDPRKPVQCFAVEASDKAKEILSGQNVKLEADSTQSERDKYGRLLRYVFLEDGTLINAKLIEDGYAFNYIYEPFQFMKQFDYLEKQAKENRTGLWSDKCNYYSDSTQK